MWSLLQSNKDSKATDLELRFNNTNSYYTKNNQSSLHIGTLYFLEHGLKRNHG